MHGIKFITQKHFIEYYDCSNEDKIKDLELVLEMFNRGAIKEKILAAKRAGITDIILCDANRKDIDEIPEIYLKGVKFHYVENVNDVWNFALTKQIVDNPLNLSVEEDDTNK